MVMVMVEKNVNFTMNLVHRIRKIIKSYKHLSDCAIRVLINDTTSCGPCEFRRGDGLCTYCRYAENVTGVR